MLLKLLEYLVANVVNRPDKVRIEHIASPKAELFYVSVAREDLGRLVGRRGRTIEAIRTFLSAIAAKLGKEAIVDVTPSRSR